MFFAGDRAYKLKKPVRTGFLDFGTLLAREAACQREVELNRRFAPGVYLGVAEVRDPGGRACDHLVVMRLLPAARRLSHLVRAGEPAGAAARQVARSLAAHHASAMRSPAISEQGSRDALRQRWQDNIDQVRLLDGSPVTAPEVDDVDQLAARFLAGRTALFDARIRDGRIVDGHGDLLAEDIFCLDDGPRILDCLEFDDRLRWLDGLDDAAFLAMDLEHLGARDLAEQFIAWYADYSGDPAPGALLHHYLAYRAFVRAKVESLRASQGDPAAAASARQLTSMTLRHLRAGTVTLVLIGGLPGTGKSTLAETLNDRLGCSVLSSDLIRKELACSARPARPCFLRHRYLHARLDGAHLYGATAPCGTAAGHGRIGDRRRHLDVNGKPSRCDRHGEHRVRRSRPVPVHSHTSRGRAADRQPDRNCLRCQPGSADAHGRCPGSLAAGHHPQRRRSGWP